MSPPVTPTSETGKPGIGKEADSRFAGLRHPHPALTIQFSCWFHGMRQESHQHRQVVFLDGSCSSTFFPFRWLLPRDQPIFCSPSKPTPEAIPEFLFHPFSGFCCFKVMRICSAAVPVIYSLWGFLERRIWIKWKIPPLFLWHFLRTESTLSIPGVFFPN